MRKWIGAAVALMAVAIVQAAEPELDVSHCRYPEPPVVPDGAAASEAEMGQAGAAVREFVANIQSSLECLTAAEESMGEDITEEQQVMLVAIYNKGVDQMNEVAANYNEQVRAFNSQ